MGDLAVAGTIASGALNALLIQGVIDWRTPGTHVVDQMRWSPGWW